MNPAAAANAITNMAINMMPQGGIPASVGTLETLQ